MGFNVNASVWIARDDDEGLERLMRYGSRPAFASQRLSLLDSLEAANAFLDDGFAERFNAKFARKAQSAEDAHRLLLDGDALSDIFRWQDERKVGRSLTVNYRRMLYVLLPTPEAKKARGQRVRIYEDEDGHVSIRNDGVELPARLLAKDGLPNRQGQVVPNKRLAQALDTIRQRQTARERQRLEVAKTHRERGLLRDKLIMTSPT